MTSQSYLPLWCGVDWTRTIARGRIITYSSASHSLRAEEYGVTCIAHDADIATDQRNPIIDCSCVQLDNAANFREL